MGSVNSVAKEPYKTQTVINQGQESQRSKKPDIVKQPSKKDTNRKSGASGKVKKNQIAAQEVEANIEELQKVRRNKKNVLYGESLDLNEKYERRTFVKTAEDLEFLKKTLHDYYLFSSLDVEELNAIIIALEPLECEANINVITQGESGDYFYLVKLGHFNCYVDGNLVCDYNRGQCFGELALLYDSPRAATVTSTEKSHLFKLDRQCFRYTLAYNNNKTIQSIRDAVNKVQILNGLDAQQINRIINIIQIVEYKKDEVIIKKGEPGNVFYIIKEGKVQCKDIGTNSTNHENTIDLSNGDYFGERALLYDEPRAATVIATTDVVCLALGRETFNEILGPLKIILEYNISSLIIRELPLLNGLLNEEKQLIIDKLQTVNVKKDQTIYNEGDLMEDFVVLKTGKLKMASSAGTSKEITAGMYLYEEIFVDTKTHSASLIALEDSVLHVVKKSSISDIKIEAKGVGSFGRVKLVQHKSSSKILALKQFKKTSIVAYHQEKNILNEKNLLIKCRHPFIQKLYNTFKDANCLYMLIEFIQGGELFNLLWNKGGYISVGSAIFYSANVLSGLSYLHDRNICYRDLKPENLMIHKDGYIRIIDFGFAKEVLDKTYTLCGTPEYLAPELVVGKGHNKSVDYWALGILIYEMLVGYSPFADRLQNKQATICRNIVRGKYVIPANLKDRDAIDIINKLLVSDPSRRLGCLKNGSIDIKKHPWYRHVDWTLLDNYGIEPPWVPPLKNEHDTEFFDEIEEDDNIDVFRGDDSWTNDF